MGCIGVGALATAGSVGCAAEPSSNSSKDHREQEDETSSSSTAQQGSSSAPQEEPISSDRATAVVFFSCTVNTEAVADKVAQAADGELVRIEAAEPYTAQDLDYGSDRRANSEQENGSARPALASPVPDIAEWGTVYLGYPIWWVSRVPHLVGQGTARHPYVLRRRRHNGKADHSLLHVGFKPCLGKHRRASCRRARGRVGRGQAFREQCPSAGDRHMDGRGPIVCRLHMIALLAHASEQ